jgi:excisionase family DNA binding protein
MPVWKTTKEAAAILGISSERVRLLYHLGKIPGTMFGGRIAFSLSAITKYAKTRKGPGRPKLPPVEPSPCKEPGEGAKRPRSGKESKESLCKENEQI